MKKGIGLYPKITVNTYNPFVGAYPDVRVISREALHAVKYLRSNGASVHFGPSDERPLVYSTQKGFSDIIAVPFYAFVIGIPVSIIANMLSSWLYEAAKDHTSKKLRGHNGESTCILEISEDGRRIRIDQHGNPISDTQFRMLIEAAEQRAMAYTKAIHTRTPDPKLPYPVFLEHTDYLIGWCDLRDEGTKLACRPAKIHDEVAWTRIQCGELSGMSIGILVRKSRCSICDREYIECNHIAGNEYSGKLCSVAILDTYVTDISIVASPVNPGCVFDITTAESTDRPKDLLI